MATHQSMENLQVLGKRYEGRSKIAAIGVYLVFLMYGTSLFMPLWFFIRSFLKVMSSELVQRYYICYMHIYIGHKNFHLSNQQVTFVFKPCVSSNCCFLFHKQWSEPLSRNQQRWVCLLMVNFITILILNSQILFLKFNQISKFKKIQLWNYYYFFISQG